MRSRPARLACTNRRSPAHGTRAAKTKRGEDAGRPQGISPRTTEDVAPRRFAAALGLGVAEVAEADEAVGRWTPAPPGEVERAHPQAGEIRAAARTLGLVAVRLAVLPQQVHALLHVADELGRPCARAAGQPRVLEAV